MTAWLDFLATLAAAVRLQHHAAVLDAEPFDVEPPQADCDAYNQAWRQLCATPGKHGIAEATMFRSRRLHDSECGCQR